MRELVNAGDSASAGREAHAMKGAAANLSAGDLRAAAHQLEMAAKAGEAERLGALPGRVETELHRLEDTLLTTGWVPAR